MQSQTSMRSPRRKVFLYEANVYHDPVDIVKAIINGVDISLVDPALYQSLVSPIQQYIFKSEERNDEIGANRLNFALQYIADYPHKAAIDRKLNPDRPVKKVKPPPLTPEQLDEELQAIFSGDLDRNYTREELNYIISAIRNKRSEFIGNEQFIEAEQCEGIVKSLASKSETCETNTILNEKVDETAQKVVEVRQQYEELRRRWNNVISNFETCRQEELQKLREDLQAEYQKQEELRTQPPPARYRKGSAYLHQLQRREQAFVAAKRFIEAENARQEAVAQEEKEKEEQKQRWIHDVDISLRKLAESQQKQYEIRKANLEKEGTKIRRQAKLDLERERRNLQRLEGLEKENRTLLIKIKEATAAKMSLPPLDTASASVYHEDSNPMSPETYRQRRILNNRIYSRKPIKSAR